MKIVPVNGHLLIEPLKHEAFISSQRETFEEIGVVISVAGNLSTPFPKDPGRTTPGGEEVLVGPGGLMPGDKVYFDSWLAAKYPNGEDGFYWLVKWEDVRAIEKNEQIPE